MNVNMKVTNGPANITTNLLNCSSILYLSILRLITKFGIATNNHISFISSLFGSLDKRSHP